MSIRQAPPRAPQLQQRQRPEEFWEPVPTAAGGGGGARLAAVLAAGERHADATGTKAGDRWKAAGNAARMAAMSAPTAPDAAPTVESKVAEKKWYEKAKDAAGEYAGEKKKEFDKWRADEATRKKELNELRSSALSAGYVRRALGGEGDCYNEAAKKARNLYHAYRQKYIVSEMKVKDAESKTFEADSKELKKLYEQYEAAVIKNTNPTDEDKKNRPMRGYNETIARGFEDGGALLAAEMEAAGTALCCDEDEDDTGGYSLKALFMPSGNDGASNAASGKAAAKKASMKALIEEAKKYKGGDVSDELLRRFKAAYKAIKGSELNDNTVDQAQAKAAFQKWFSSRVWRIKNMKSYYNVATIDAAYGFEAEVDEDEVQAGLEALMSLSEEDVETGCGWDAMRGMTYPCGMVFAMVGADGATRLYCASGRPPSDYDNASGLKPLSHISSELHEMLEKIAHMWPSAPRYTNYVLVPQGQSEPAPAPAPEPEPPTTTRLKIPISDLEAPGGAEKLTQYVMDWLKKLNVKVNEDDKTNAQLDGVAEGRAAAAPYNLGKGGFAPRYEQRVARRYRDKLRQLAAATRAKRAANQALGGTLDI
jgi:hypothetical protein